MTLNELLYGQQRMSPNMPGGDATLGSTGLFVPRGMPPSPLSNQTTATMLKSRLPTANFNAVTDPASVPFFAGGPAITPAVGNLPQFADPRVQAMMPSVLGPARSATPPAASAPMQGPPMPPEFNMPGFARGMGYSTPGMSAQQYADQFAGGDVSKVKARQIMVDGQLVNDFYTKGLLDGLLGGPAAMKPLEGTPANVPLPPQRPAEFGPSYQGGGLLSNLPFIGGLFGG